MTESWSAEKYVTQEVSEQMVTAPVLWNNGKAYLFEGRIYYRYDV
ncbi:MAG: hypothetical protein JWL99_2487, partial [Streptomyces oryziradicis]|nr:hypothetical protein [Actinacidiphila oryziradicis]